MRRYLIAGSLVLAFAAQLWAGLAYGQAKRPAAAGAGVSLPDQTGNSGKFLTTNGTAASWSFSAYLIGAVGSSPNANGATLSGGTLTLQPASASFPGLVTTGTQTFAGSKTFSAATLFSDGAVTTPSVSFASDTNTGLWSFGADNIGIAVGGSRAFVIANAAGRMYGTDANSSLDLAASGAKLTYGSTNLLLDGAKATLSGGGLFIGATANFNVSALTLQNSASLYYNSSGAPTYLKTTATSTNTGLVLYNTTAFITGGRFLEIRDSESGTLRLYVDKDGNVVPGSSAGATLGISTTLWDSAFLQTLKDGNSNQRIGIVGAAGNVSLGAIANGASAIAHKFGNTASLSTAGAKIASFYSDALTTEKAYFTKDGALAITGVASSENAIVIPQFSYMNFGGSPSASIANAGTSDGIPIIHSSDSLLGSAKGVRLAPGVTLSTCGSTTEGNIQRDTSSGGTTGRRTALCLCTSDGAGTPAYAWVHMRTGTVGTTTTCPD